MVFVYILVSLSPGLPVSYSFSWQMSWYGFLAASSSETLPLSGSFRWSSWRDKCSTMPAPMESPRTLVTVRSRSLLEKRRERQRGAGRREDRKRGEDRPVDIDREEMRGWEMGRKGSSDGQGEEERKRKRWDEKRDRWRWSGRRREE